ncbi:MAG TPA: hypothetical protein VN917_09295 [Xanthobacteraceae bacterium]|nr:hypothetical protein [Xanthobacteraceae bacterium]
MISQLFALPLRALIVAAALPTPPAQGGILAGPGGTPGPAMMASLPDPSGFTLEARIATHSSPRSAENSAGR